MPPPKASQGVLRFPLTALLGNEANVRVLREMFHHGGELSAPALAERVGLSRQHVHRTLGALVDLKVVERVGVGGHPSYRVRAGFPLHAILDELFRAEKERYQAIIRAIVDAVRGKPVQAVWLYGSVARGEDLARSDVDIALVVDAADVDLVTDRVREQLRLAEETLGVNVSIVGISMDDVLRLSAGDPWWDNVLRDAVALSGPDPERLAARIRRSEKLSRQPAESR